jgi:hypothetical protein
MSLLIGGEQDGSMSQPLPHSNNVALVLLSIDHEKKLLTARCTRDSCSNKCIKAKAQSGQSVFREVSCGHVRGTWEYANAFYPTFKVGVFCQLLIRKHWSN